MAKKKIEVKETPEVKAEVKSETSEVKKQSVREIMNMESAEIIEQAQSLIPKLEQLQAFALKNNRPHRHFFVFKKQLESFVNQFKRMLR